MPGLHAVTCFIYIPTSTYPRLMNRSTESTAPTSALLHMPTDLPQLTVNLGAAIKRENIREETDVYLECK